MHYFALRLRNRGSSFRKDQSGGILVYTAILLPVLLGVAAMSIDVGNWFLSKRVAQAAADAGALAGALEVMRLNQDPDGEDINESDVLNIALASAGENGYDSASGHSWVAHYPPANGPYVGAGDAVEVIVQRPTGTFLSQLLTGDDEVNVAARAVAVVDVNDTCMWALNRTKKNAIKISGGANVNMPCGIMSNSNDPDESLGVDGGGCVTATKIKTAGKASGDCVHPSALENVQQVNDPFGNMVAPSFGGCDDSSNIKVNSGETLTLEPGVYCGKIDVSGGTLNFEAGDYVLDGAGVSVSSDSVVTGSDVSFFISEDSGQGDNITISGGAIVDLSAPWDGDNPGVLFYQDRDSPANIQHVFAGGASMNLEGILYFPNQDLQFTGGTDINPVTTVIVADTLTFSGNTDVSDFDGSVIQANPNLITVTLVE